MINERSVIDHSANLFVFESSSILIFHFQALFFKSQSLIVEFESSVDK